MSGISGVEGKEDTMKHWIIAIAGGALALGLIVAPDAEGWWSHGPDVDLSFAGSSTVVDVDEDTGDTSTLQVTQAKGKRGNAHLNSNVVYGPLGPYEGCPVFGADATASWVATYRDGSVLTGSGSGFVCTDGTVFTGDVSGGITGTVGRFEGASGTWDAQASVVNSAFTGTLTADFD